MLVRTGRREEIMHMVEFSLLIETFWWTNQQGSAFKISLPLQIVDIIHIVSLSMAHNCKKKEKEKKKKNKSKI